MSIRRDSCRIPFRFLRMGTLVAGVDAMTLSPTAVSTRLTTESDAWSLFRVIKFKYRFHPNGVGTACGYAAGIIDTAPSTIAQVMELLPSTYMDNTQTCPGDWIALSPSECHGAFQWYKTVPGAGTDPGLEYPGVLYFAGTLVETYNLEIMGEYEFKDAIAAANTPSVVALRRKIREERQAAADLRMVRKNLAGISSTVASLKL